MISLNTAAFAFSKIQGNHSLGFWENGTWPLARDLCSLLAGWVEKIAQTKVRETSTPLLFNMCTWCHPSNSGQMVPITLVALPSGIRVGAQPSLGGAQQTHARLRLEVRALWPRFASRGKYGKQSLLWGQQFTVLKRRGRVRGVNYLREEK